MSKQAQSEGIRRFHKRQAAILRPVSRFWEEPEIFPCFSLFSNRIHGRVTTSPLRVFGDAPIPLLRTEPLVPAIPFQPSRFSHPVSAIPFQPSRFSHLKEPS
jgi:hypothetical protein